MTTIVIFGALMMAMAIAALRRPGAAFASMVCLYGIQQWSDANNAIFQDHRISNTTVAVIVAGALCAKVVRGDNPLRRYPAVGYIAIAIFCYAFASVYWTLNPDDLLRGFERVLPRTTIFLLLVPLLVTKPDDLKDALEATVGFGFVVLLLLWFGTSIRYQPGAIEVQTGWSNRIYSNYLALGTLAGQIAMLALFLQVGRAPRAWAHARWAVVVLALAVLVMSTARGQMVAFLVGTCVLAVLVLRKRRVQVVGVAMAVAVAWFVGQWASEMLSTSERFELGRMEDAVRVGRIDTSFALLDYWWQSGSLWTVFFGLGNSASYSVIGGYPHFTALEVLGEEGIFGAMLMLAALTWTAREFGRGYRAVEEDEQRRTHFSCLFGLFVFELVTSCKAGCLLGDAMLFAFATMVSRYPLLLQDQRRASATSVRGAPPPVTRGAQGEAEEPGAGVGDRAVGHRGAGPASAGNAAGVRAAVAPFRGA